MSLANGLFGLNQSMSTPARLSQGQSGLLTGLGEALNPTPQVDINDPNSMREAAQHAMNKGDTVKGAQLMQQAQDVETKTKEGRIENIRKSYGMMEAKGKADIFEQAMVQAGESDLIAQIKREKKADDLINMEYQDAKAANNIKQMTNSFYKADTPEGRQEALQVMRDGGYAKAASELNREYSAAEVEERVILQDQLDAQYDELKTKVDRRPVVTSEEGHQALLSTLDPSVRDYASARRDAILGARQEHATLMEKPVKLEESMVKEAGMTLSQYNSMVSGLGSISAANKAVFKAREERLGKKQAGEVASPTAVKNTTEAIKAYVTAKTPTTLGIFGGNDVAREGYEAVFENPEFYGAIAADERSMYGLSLPDAMENALRSQLKKGDSYGGGIVKRMKRDSSGVIKILLENGEQI